MKIPKNILIASRASFIRTKEGVYFEALDGQYINDISKLFEKVTVIAYEIDSDNSYNEILLLDKKVSYLSRLELLKFRNILILIREIQNYDIVYVFYPLISSLFFALLAKMNGKMVIAYNGGVWSQMKPISEKVIIIKKLKVIFYNFLEYLSIWCSSIYIANNNSIFKKYSNKFNVVKAVPLLRIGRNGIFNRNDTCNGDTIRILSVNVIKPGKKIIELIQAYQLLLSHEKKFKLTIIGEYDIKKPYALKLSNFIKDNNLENEIEFTGNITDINKLIHYYRTSDIFCLISESEGFPRVIWESFSQSLPVLCSPLPNITTEFSKEKQPIYFLNNNEPETIKTAIMNISRDKDLRKSLIINGVEYFNKKTVKTPYEQLKQIIKK